MDYNVNNTRAWILVDLQIQARQSSIQLLLTILEFTIRVHSEDHCRVLNVHIGQFTNSVTIMGQSLSLFNCKSDITILEFLHVCGLRDDRPQGFWFDLHKDMIAPRKEILIVLLTAPNYWKFRSQSTNNLLWGKIFCPVRMATKYAWFQASASKWMRTVLFWAVCCSGLSAVLDCLLLDNPHEGNSQQNMQFMAYLK